MRVMRGILAPRWRAVLMVARLVRSLYHSTLPTRRGVSWWDASEFGLAALGFLLYFLVRGAVSGHSADAIRHSNEIVRFTVWLGIFVEPRVNHFASGSEPIWRLLNFVYFWFDFPLIVAVGLYFFARQRHWYTVLRDSLLASGAIALLVYWRFPVAPPRLLTEWGFVDTMQVHAHLSYQAQSLQPFVNPFAAVPSLHVGWAALLAYAVWGATRRWLARAAVTLVLLLQSIAVIATANHFMFDAALGLVVCAAGLGVAYWLQQAGYPAVRRSLQAVARRLDGQSAHAAKA